MTNNCRKGKRVELKVVHWLHRLGLAQARRGQQYAGGTDSPDVLVPELPHVHFEVKGRVERPATAEMARWLDRARKDAGPDKEVALVVVENGRAPVLVWAYEERGLVCAINDEAAQAVLSIWALKERLRAQRLLEPAPSPCSEHNQREYCGETQSDVAADAAPRSNGEQTPINAASRAGARTRGRVARAKGGGGTGPPAGRGANGVVGSAACST